MQIGKENASIQAKNVSIQKKNVLIDKVVKLKEAGDFSENFTLDAMKIIEQIDVMQVITSKDMMRRKTDPKGLGSMNWGLFLVLQKGSLHQREMQGARSYEMLFLTHSFKPSTPSKAFTSFSPAIEAFFINGRRRSAVLFISLPPDVAKR